MTIKSDTEHATPQQAIEGYLDALLQDVTEEEPAQGYVPEREVTAPPAPRPLRAESRPQRTQVREALNIKLPELTVAAEPVAAEPVVVQPEPPVEAPAAQHVAAEPAPQPPVTAAPAATDGGWPGWINGRPEWAQERFECLLFKVSGLTLAVPLKELGGIHKVAEKPTPLFGQPDWFLGLVRSSHHNVQLVDTAKWVMPEHYREEIRDGFKYAIRIEGYEWGLACDEVAEAISLEPSEVRWRSKGGKRPWLAGTVIKHMCALIDVAAFARLLEEADKNRRRHQDASRQDKDK